MLRHLIECWSTYCTYTFTTMTHRRWSHFTCFRSAQQTLREKWVELQSLTLQEKRLTRGEKKKKLLSLVSSLSVPGAYCHSVWLCFPYLALEVLVLTVSFTFNCISQHSVCHYHSSVHCTQLFPVIIVPSCSVLTLFGMCIYSLSVLVCVQSRCYMSLSLRFVLKFVCVLFFLFWTA